MVTVLLHPRVVGHTMNVLLCVCIVHGVVQEDEMVGPCSSFHLAVALDMPSHRRKPAVAA